MYRLKGKDRIILVTDAMHAAGQGDGTFDFGGHPVEVRDGVARNSDGQLASSTITLLDAVRNAMRYTGAALEDIVPMVTRNPARAIGMDSRMGSIEPGKLADLVVLDGQIDIRAVFCRGALAHDRGLPALQRPIPFDCEGGSTCHCGHRCKALMRSA